MDLQIHCVVQSPSKYTDIVDFNGGIGRLKQDLQHIPSPLHNNMVSQAKKYNISIWQPNKEYNNTISVGKFNKATLSG